MTINEIFPFFLAFASISLGAFFGALGNRLVTVNNKTNWKWAFYILGIVSILSGVIGCIFIKSESIFLYYLTIILLISSGILLIFFTKKYIDIKYIFKTSELYPIINKFTESSDRKAIRLFGGDLNFFGNEPTEMDKNEQYNFLKSLKFKSTLILCEEPGDTSTKIRYGKILQELNNVELRFYHPEEADLLIRGRMKTISGVEKLLIYSKIESGKYHAIETDTANSNGALYNNIWKLIWSLATRLSSQQKTEYKDLYMK